MSVGFLPPRRVPDDEIDWALVGWTLLAVAVVIATFWIGVWLVGAALLGWLT